MPTSPRAIAAMLFAVATLAAPIADAGAQTTVVLDTPATQVTDTMIQAGASAAKNFSAADMFATRASTNPDYLRRALIKFDTQNTLAARTIVRSAVLTLTVKAAGADSSRTISVFPVNTSFVQEQATWKVRRLSTAWATAGGDLGAEATRKAVPNTVGAKVSFDVTNLVQAAVNGATSRYTRLALADLGASTAASYREFFSSKATVSAVRPVLTIVLGATTTVAPPPVVAPPSNPPLSRGVQLRVLQYNTHHGGYGTDGVFSTDRIADWVVKANADVVSLQEVEVRTSWSKGLDDGAIYQKLLESRTGQTWYKVYLSRYGTDSGLGQLILSKYPFIATAPRVMSGSRSAVDATIAVNGRTINITSVHLDNELQSTRIHEIGELLPFATTLAENRIIVGDFNAWPNTTEIATMAKTYIDTWTAAKAAGTAVSWSTNPDGITHAHHRIDYIFQSRGATALMLRSAQVFDTSDHSGGTCVSGCFANSTGIDPSDHRPLMAVFDVR
jgi:endonuclease/exonuclease/phosphatase family metal-dependent hydrolase